MIQIRNLVKQLGDNLVLRSVDLDINDGETLCIIGKSGCGKSVLLKHVVGLLQPDSGEVIVDDFSVPDLTKEQLFEMRKHIGYVFQGAALFDSLTVFENVVLRLYEHNERNKNVLINEAKSVLSAVGLLPDIAEKETEHFNREWQVLANKMPSDLSGGMKKRVAVARALIGTPRYIFYDEPTTGLDPVTSDRIDNLIAKLSKKLNSTAVLITHDMFSVYKIAEKVAMLNDGKIQFYGNVAELKASTDPVVQEFLERYRN